MNPIPDQNQTNSNPLNISEDTTQQNLPQLEKETPMDITIYPSNENPNNIEEPQKLSEEKNNTNPVVQSNSIPSQITFDEPSELKTISNQQTETPLESVNSIIASHQEPKNEKFNPVNSIISNPIESSIQQQETKPQEIKSIQDTPTQNEILTEEIKPLTDPNLKAISSLAPALNSENKEETTSKQSNQKVAIIVGAAFGIFLVSGISYYLVSVNKKAATQPETIAVEQPATNLIKPSLPTTTPEIAKLSTEEYKLKIDSVNTKFNSLISSNPLNLNGVNLNIQVVQLLGNEIFALYNEVTQYSVTENLKPSNDKVAIELQNLYITYDELLKSYKVSGTLTPEMKAKFLMATKSSTDKLKSATEEIKNLK